MKFKAPDKPKVHWSAEMIREKMAAVEKDIGVFNRELNKLDTRMNVVVEEKRIIRMKISNKRRYFNQLLKQLDEEENGKWE